MRNNVSVVLLAVALLVVAPAGWTRSSSKQDAKSPEKFEPFEQWKDFVLKSDSMGLKTLYSTNPVAQIKVGSDRDLDISGDFRFWTGMKAKSMKIDVLQSGESQVQPGTYQILFRAEIQLAEEGKEKTFYITEGQLWRQQDKEWKLILAKRTEPSRLEQPADSKKNIYPATADAHADIKKALEKAGKEHKRVLVVFGANWCYDCHVLDLAFERDDIAPLVEANYEVVHVDVGEGDKNQDLMKEYQVPMDRGIPAIAVLDSTGKVLFSQKNGEFEKARALGPEDLVNFLEQWKPQKS
jgi:thiol-disulfide isomerase/thioredoxin